MPSMIRSAGTAAPVAARMVVNQSVTCMMSSLISPPTSARRELEDWKRRTGKQPVVDFAQSLTSKYLYEITSERIEEAAAKTTHALAWNGGVGLRRDVAESVESIVGWHPNFPIVHTLYYAIEQFRRPPLWLELVEFWRSDRQAKPMLGVEARDAVDQAVGAGASAEAAEEAMWWRLGNAYYSCLREIYILALLREQGIPAQYHVVADALFRADLWVDDTIVSIYVTNAKFRDGAGGRKRSARSILGDFPGFRFVDIPRIRAGRARSTGQSCPGPRRRSRRPAGCARCDPGRRAAIVRSGPGARRSARPRPRPRCARWPA